MIYQEDILEFFENMAEDMRNENIPILNLLYEDFPEYSSKEGIQEIAAEENSDDESEVAKV